jgi:hypothetical protein
MLRRPLLVLVACALLVQPSAATWSIVVVDRRTGEVGIAAATCIPRTNLLSGLATVVVGRGGGVVQASGDFGDLVPMSAGLRQGLTPAEILELVKAAEPTPRVLQTGIVALYPGAPATFTGEGVGRASSAATGAARARSRGPPSAELRRRTSRSPRTAAFWSWRASGIPTSRA